MPSASSKSSQQPAQPVSADLLQEPLKSALQVFEKKQRNLEKRKVKLVETKKKAELGGALNEDQKQALSNIALVDNSLDTVKELHKLVQTLELEYNKLARKEQKRSKQESRDQAEAKSHTLGLKIIQIQAILGDLSEEVRPDFLAGSNGACQLTEDELLHLDNIYELINPAKTDENTEKLSVRIKIAGVHLLNLVEAKDASVCNVTYKQISDILEKINASGYFDKDSYAKVEVPAASEVVEDIPQEQVASEEAHCTPEEEFLENTPAEEAESQEEVATVVEEETPAEVNGVDLPPEVQQTPEDEKIDFLGESEITSATGELPSLNPVSPEFVPRTFQAEDASGWGEKNENEGWEQIEKQGDNRGNNQDGFRGRGRGGGRSRGRGRGGSGGFRGRQDGGNYRGESGGYRGEGGYRGDGGYRGSNRGSRGGNRGEGGYRGGNRGGNRGAPRGGSRGGGFGRPSNE